MDIPLYLIELQARWQTDRANGEHTVQQTMAHTYSEVRNMKDKLVDNAKDGPPEPTIWTEAQFVDVTSF